ncbi:molecular chaperone [Aeromonas phage ZPAH1]|nr:hypothetical protein ASwh1_116 [Aeromonas phage Aswh_1]QQG33928.1 molecular chaperone [Aeromonas phage ZPAH1]
MEKYSVGKNFRIVGEVAKEHGDCFGHVITLTGVGHDAAWFSGLSWVDGIVNHSGDYILAYPDNVSSSFDGDLDYFDWLDDVLEEVK